MCVLQLCILLVLLVLEPTCTETFLDTRARWLEEVSCLLLCSTDDTHQHRGVAKQEAWPRMQSGRGCGQE